MAYAFQVGEKFYCDSICVKQAGADPRSSACVEVTDPAVRCVCGCVIVPPPLLTDLIAISSGTLAHLSKITGYASIQHLQGQLCSFYRRNPEGDYTSWVDVWDAFVRSGGLAERNHVE